MKQPDLDDVWDVLVQECGVPDDDWTHENFVQHALVADRYDEYRFQGAFGFGGKLYWWPTRPPTVNCYREDQTPERLAMIERANKRLAELCADGDAP